MYGVSSVRVLHERSALKASCMCQHLRRGGSLPSSHSITDVYCRRSNTVASVCVESVSSVALSWSWMRERISIVVSKIGDRYHAVHTCSSPTRLLLTACALTVLSSYSTALARWCLVFGRLVELTMFAANGLGLGDGLSLAMERELMID